MKVVLFCGGFGMRMRGYSENVPKPMVKIGYRPILWHIMKYYAHFGHKDFVLCLGYKADVIKRYFLEYSEAISNDFVLTEGGKNVELLQSDIEDWRITFVDTGLNACVGERLMAVREHLDDEDVFLANYADGLSDVHLPSMIDFFEHRNKVGAFLGVSPNASFHPIQASPDGHVQDIHGLEGSNMRINGGFFVFKNEIFNYMEPGDELVEAPFQRLIADRELVTYMYDGFWACMDTFKEKQLLDDMHRSENVPWEVWKPSGDSGKLPMQNGSRDGSAISSDEAVAV